MLLINNVLSFFILMCLFYFGYSDANSSVAQAQPQFISSGKCKVKFDPKTNEIKLESKLIVDAQSKRATCNFRLSYSNPQKQARLVPLALKGTVKKVPATISIRSSLFSGSMPPIKLLSKEYTSPTKFDLTKQVPKTNYTTNGVFGINLVLATTRGELELTDLKFALQRK